MKAKLEIPNKTERGFCPLLSGRIMPKPTGGLTAQANMITMEPVIIDCPGESCQWWSVPDGCCCIRSVSYLAMTESLSGVLRSILEATQPPDSGSPIMRIANALEKIVELRKQPPVF